MKNKSRRVNFIPAFYQRLKKPRYSHFNRFLQARRADLTEAQAEGLGHGQCDFKAPQERCNSMASFTAPNYRALSGLCGVLRIVTQAVGLG